MQEHGTFVLAGGLDPDSIYQYRRCPVCCTGPLATDSDMSLFAASDGSRWWICERFEDCGFAYPEAWEEGQPRLEALIEQRQSFLRGSPATVA